MGNQKLCGIVWAHNGGEISKIGCDMGSVIKMTRYVCVWNGVFSCEVSPCLGTIFTKSTRNIRIALGTLSATPFTGKLWGVTPGKLWGVTHKCVEWGGG